MFLRRVQSPYTLSIYQQVMLCVERGFQRLRGDASVTISRVVANSVLALVVGKKPLQYSRSLTDDPLGSMFYNLNETTSSFYSRSVLIFLAILLNAFASALEVFLVKISSPQLTNYSRSSYFMINDQLSRNMPAMASIIHSRKQLHLHYAICLSKSATVSRLMSFSISWRTCGERHRPSLPFCSSRLP
jgi:hypothetical protein